MKKRVLAGMRASGKLHLGNYFGGARGMVALQENPNYETFYMIANIHGITTPFNPKDLKENTKEVVLDYLASGLDPEKSVIFRQSDIDLHAEFAFYLSSVVTIARMQHLPTFKEKVKQYPEGTTMALLNYPILMASDILLYKARFVPVGIDQEPHLEVAREIVRKMDEYYDLDLPEPQRFTLKGGEYIPSLTGEGKMSKSVAGSFIALTDDLEQIKEHLASAPTDSGKGKKIPTKGGVANLFTFVELFQGKEKRKEYEKQYTSSGIRYKDLKEELAEAIYKELRPIQEKRKKFENDPRLVDKILKEGAEKARKVAGETLEEVKEKMGLA